MECRTVKTESEFSRGKNAYADVVDLLFCSVCLISLFLLSSTREEVVFNSVAFALRLIDARKPFKISRPLQVPRTETVIPG